MMRGGIGLKAKRISEKRPFIESRTIPNYSHNKNKFVDLLRVINRDSNLYFEQVTDYESGEIIHKCEEPLSQHQGHGSAKRLKPA